MLRIFFIILLLVPVSLFSQEAGFKSIHQEQSEYYGQFSQKDVILFDSLHYYTRTSNPFPADTCTLRKLVFGFHPYWMGNAYLDYRWELISDFCYFSYEVDPMTGNYNSIHGWLTDPSVDSARAHGVRTHLCATLFSGHAAFFSSQSARQNLIDQLIMLVQQRDADGINIDFEAVPLGVRQELTGFMIDLSEQFHGAHPDGLLSIDLPAVDWEEVFDVEALREYVDLFFIMGYDYYWNSSSTAGPVAPLYPLTGSYDLSLCRTVSDYQSRGLPGEKMILGLPYYARLWKTASGSVPSATLGTGTAYTYSYIMNNQAGGFVPENRKWEPNSQSSCYIYNQNSNWYQCFIPMQRDLRERYDLVNYRDLAGAGIWALGYDSGRAELWEALRDRFTDCAEVIRADTLYDCGGPAWNYHNMEEYTLTIRPGFTGRRHLEFREFSTEAGSDSLWIFYCPDTLPILAGGYSGSLLPGVFSTDCGDWQIRFRSDGAVTSGGWKAIWHDGTLGTELDNISGGSLLAYPVPFRDELNILWPGAAGAVISVSCSDILGRAVPLKAVKAEGAASGEGRLVVHFFPTGVAGQRSLYFLTLYRGDEWVGRLKVLRVE